MSPKKSQRLQVTPSPKGMADPARSPALSDTSRPDTTAPHRIQHVHRWSCCCSRPELEVLSWVLLLLLHGALGAALALPRPPCPHLGNRNQNTSLFSAWPETRWVLKDPSTSSIQGSPSLSLCLRPPKVVHEPGRASRVASCLASPTGVGGERRPCPTAPFLPLVPQHEPL